MAIFNLKIAGHTGTVSSLFESTPQYFKNYLTQESSEFSFCVTREDIAFEQADLLEEAHRDGFKPRVFTDPFLERAAIQRAFAEFLFERDTLLFHGSALAVDGQGYLFTAKSGTGKSTHSEKWNRLFGAEYINDDKPYISVKDEFFIHGSPWMGVHRLGNNVSYPLSAICIICRSENNRIERVQKTDVFSELIKQTYMPKDCKNAKETLFLVSQLSFGVEVYKLHCNMDDEAANVAYNSLAHLFL